MLSYTIAAVILIYNCLSPASAGDSCVVKPDDRVECSYKGISKGDCEKQGCCFDSTINNTQWCFLNKETTAHLKSRSCAVVPTSRRECGLRDISKELCQSKNCCFDNSVKNALWCFQYSDGCVVKPDDRIECGYEGISKGDCEKRGCCFDSTINNTKWCFLNKETTAHLKRDGCVVKPDDRVECGYEGISKGDCEKRGCCFHSTINNTKWCFLNEETTAHLKLYIVGTCEVELANRYNCDIGIPNISEALCRRRGCCYDKSTPTATVCYYSRDQLKRSKGFA